LAVSALVAFRIPYGLFKENAMNVYNMQVTALRAAMLTVAMLALPSMAWACCPDDGKT
jgi:hypothetical protein